MLAVSQAKLSDVWDFDYEGTFTYNITVDFQEFMHIMYSGYNGFVRGFYREQAQTLVDERCLNAEWIAANLTHLTSVMDRMFNQGDLNIPYDDAREAMIEVVDLLYLSNDYCQVKKVGKDFLDMLESCDVITEEEIFLNFKNGWLTLAMKASHIWDLFTDDNAWMEDEAKMVGQYFDTTGDIFGTFLSYISGFDQRFNPQISKQKSLAAASQNSLVKIVRSSILKKLGKK